MNLFYENEGGEREKEREREREESASGKLPIYFRPSDDGDS